MRNKTKHERRIKNMTECIDRLKFNGDNTIFCPMRNGCCIKECPAYIPAVNAKHGNPWSSCGANFLVGNR
jgi:hypothetical protein